jgi:predicted nucleic acid-binding protein
LPRFALCPPPRASRGRSACPRDPDDIPVLATLIAGKADVLVTGDADLLVLREQFPVETPREFVQRLR